MLKELKKAGESFSRSELYYHPSELEEVGIIEVASYRKIWGGAPEKTWRLKTKEIKINLLQNKILQELFAWARTYKYIQTR